MGVAEIADLLGVSRQRVDQLVRLGAGFPPPVAELEAGRIWLAEEIERWARAVRRIE
jgi:prophage regulatory protein